MNIELLEQPGTEITVQDRAAIALASDSTRKDLLAMAAKYAAITEIKNKAGRDECHSAAMTLAGARIAISKTGKAARDDATKFSKAVIAEEASLIAITEPEEKRLLALRDGWDEVIAAEKSAREAAERARVMAITERIAGIRQYVELAASCRTSARIDELLTKLSLTSLGGFEEFSDEAGVAHLDAMERVTAILTAKLEQEAEQARIKAGQEEATAKLANERAVFAAQQAAAKAEADRLAAERLELERQRKEFEDQVLEVKMKAAQAEAAETRAIVAANKAMLEQQAEDAAMIATHEEEVKQAATKEDAPDWEPTDADVMWEAVRAVAMAFNMPTEHATARLAAVQWTI